MKILRRAAKKVLSRLGLIKPSGFSGLPNPIHKWADDDIFLEIMKRVEGRTLVDIIRCYMLYQFAQQAVHLPGDVAEVGVYKGGTARLLAEAVGRASKRIHLFDTFRGMPATDPDKDIHKEGDFHDTSLAEVRSFLADLQNVQCYPGLFPDTAGSIVGEVFSLVHVDVDIYKSVKECLNFFYPRMVSSGIMVFDDYGFVTCPGARQAVDEFFESKEEKPFYLPTGQCFIIKL
jgi:O-methyltransferase